MILRRQHAIRFWLRLKRRRCRPGRSARSAGRPRYGTALGDEAGHRFSHMTSLPASMAAMEIRACSAAAWRWPPGRCPCAPGRAEVGVSGFVVRFADPANVAPGKLADVEAVAHVLVRAGPAPPAADEGAAKGIAGRGVPAPSTWRGRMIGAATAAAEPFQETPAGEFFSCVPSCADLLHDEVTSARSPPRAGTWRAPIPRLLIASPRNDAANLSRWHEAVKSRQVWHASGDRSRPGRTGQPGSKETGAGGLWYHAGDTARLRRQNALGEPWRRVIMSVCRVLVP